MKKYHFAILFAIGLTASSCTTAEIPLEEDPDPITQTVTYVGDVKAIIDNNCTTCHGTVNPNAGLSLVTYQQVRNSAENGNLIPRMNNEQVLCLLVVSYRLPPELLLTNGDKTDF